MYHPVKDQELHPGKYKLTNINPNILEDECHDFLSKPRQTQTTIGLYLKKDDQNGVTGELPNLEQRLDSRNSIKPDPNKRDNYLEKLVEENKGFWIDKPTLTAPLITKLNKLYNVELPSKKKVHKKNQVIFYRPDYFEWDYLIELGQKGLLYSDEEISDSEEVEPDPTLCIPLRKERYKICDPCKPKVEKQKKCDKVEGKYFKTPIKKIPTGCQCNYYGEHNNTRKLWDNPFRDEEDMIRQHEMNKCLRPYKTEILRSYYIKTPPASFETRKPNAKRTFPAFTLSNL